MPMSSHHGRTTLRASAAVTLARDCLLLLRLMCVICTASTAHALNTGDILVTSRGGGNPSALCYVDHITGVPHQVVSAANGSLVDVTSAPNGDIYAVSGGSMLYKVDPVTGSLTVISQQGSLISASWIQRAPDGNLYVVDGTNGLIRVDPSSGSQSIVTSGVIQALAIDLQGVGYIALADDVFSSEPYHIYRVDLTTGTRTLASPTGLTNPVSLVAEGTDKILVCQTENFDNRPVGVLRMDLTTGAVTTVSTDSRFMRPISVALNESGEILMADYQHLISCAPPGGTQSCIGALYRIDSLTGSTTLLADQGLMDHAMGIDIYRGPSIPTPTRRVSWGSVKAHYR